MESACPEDSRTTHPYTSKLNKFWLIKQIDSRIVDVNLMKSIIHFVSKSNWFNIPNISLASQKWLLLILMSHKVHRIILLTKSSFSLDFHLFLSFCCKVLESCLLSLTSNISVKTYSILTCRGCFGILRMSRFQNWTSN